MDKILIIGAGPAGLSAAYHILKNSNIKPVIIESDSIVGGISRTVTYKKWRFDIGPHRFFSKSKEVLDFWFEILPLSEKGDINKMVVKNRYTRIYNNGKFFDYPIKLNIKNIKNLTIKEFFLIIFSYLFSKMFFLKKEKSLEDFFIKRFGFYLYKKFFKNYTEKVWGVSCDKISAEWGEQRVKKLSILNIFKDIFNKNINILHKTKHTSLIEYFYYPINGSGSLYEALAKKIEEMGGVIYLNTKVDNISISQNNLLNIRCKNSSNNYLYFNNYTVISSMPIINLINIINNVPSEIIKKSKKLLYRDLILVFLVFKRNNIVVNDNWIYIHDDRVKLARISLYNNFSEKLSSSNEEDILLGIEYFCQENDELWNLSNEQLINFARSELKILNIFNSEYLDGFSVKQKKAYPSYFGGYNKFSDIKNFLNSIDNLYCIGRNGQHRYNNMDHSILTGMVVVNKIINKDLNKENLWSVNSEKEYHE